MKWILHFIGKLLLTLTGWKPGGKLPDVPKFVLIAAPHTSNWDLPVMLMIGAYFGVWPKWIGKKELFGPPFGWFMKLLGGIPVDRSKHNNLVDAAAHTFKTRESLILAVPPEGSRKKMEYWKTGFYYIAEAAGVPVCLGFLDYGNKVGGFGPLLMPTGNIGKDFDILRNFYKASMAHKPQNFGEIRIRPVHQGKE